MPDSDLYATLRAMYGISGLPPTASDICSCVQCMRLVSRHGELQAEDEEQDGEDSWSGNIVLEEGEISEFESIITIIESTPISNSIILTFARSEDTGATSLWAGRRGGGFTTAHLSASDAGYIRKRQETVRLGELADCKDLQTLKFDMNRDAWSLAVTYGLVSEEEGTAPTYELSQTSYASPSSSSVDGSGKRRS